MPVLTDTSFSFPPDRLYRAELEQELRRLSRETGTKRIATLEHERREQEKESMAIHPSQYPQTKLARGLDSQNSPHSVAAARAKREAAKRDELKAREAKGKAERKAKREAVSTETTKITILNKAYVFGREGSTRNANWQTCLRSKTVGDYLANGGLKKYLPRWEQAGAIRLG